MTIDGFLSTLFEISPYAAISFCVFILFWLMHKHEIKTYENLYSKSIAEIRLSYKESYEKLNEFLKK